MISLWVVFCSLVVLTCATAEADEESACRGSDAKYTITCLTRLWLEAGCSLRGTGRPDINPKSVEWWNQRNLVAVKKDMSEYTRFAKEGRDNGAGQTYSDLCYRPEEPSGNKTDTFTHGHSTVNRDRVDTWSNAIYIPGPSSPIPHDGHVVKFNFYARHTGTIYMQIWRKTDSAHVYELVGSERASVTSTGSQTVEPSSAVNVRKGDLLGFYFPGNAIIPFEGNECWSDRTYYKRNPSSADIKVGAKVRFQIQEAGWYPCRKYSLSVTISTGTPMTHGNDPIDRPSLDEWSSAMYILTPRTPIGIPGKVISWTIYAKKTGTIYLQAFEKVGYQRYKVVGQTKIVVDKVGAQIFKLDPSQQFSVNANHVLGFYFPDNSIIPFTGSSCLSNRVLYRKNPGTVSVGDTFYFSQKEAGWRPCRKYSVRVTVLAKPGITHGDEPTNRKSLDNWRNAMYIINPTNPIPSSGSVSSWEMYANRTGTIYLQVFRKVSGYNRYKIVGQLKAPVTETGVQLFTVSSDAPINVARGDLIGFYFPGSSIIPFDGTEGCSSGQTLYNKDPYGVRVGAIFTFLRKQASWKPCRKYSLRLTLRHGSGTDEEEGSGDDNEGSGSSETITLERR